MFALAGEYESPAQAQTQEQDPAKSFGGLEGYTQRRLQSQDTRQRSVTTPAQGYRSLPVRPNEQPGPQNAPSGSPRRRSNANRVSEQFIEAGVGDFFKRRDKAVPTGSPETRIPLANDETPVAKRNSYVIHVKSGTTPAQIDTLLAKYGLTLDKGLDAIGTYYVSEVNPKPDASEAQRSVGAILQPKLVRDLQSEAIVESAAVNAALTVYALPRGVTTEVAYDGRKISWNWDPVAEDDGNWALKRLRMPLVWTALFKHRFRVNAGSSPIVAVVDSGFAQHRDLIYRNLSGSFAPIAQVGGSPCEWGHGTHVAGIAGATFDNGFGIDGAVPDANIEAVPYQQDPVAFDVSGNAPLLQNFTSMAEALEAIYDFVIAKRRLPDYADKRYVMNISLGYNWKRVLDRRPDDDNAVQGHVRDEALAFRRLALLGRDHFLFVVAAGNDSNGYNKAVNARWSSPFAFVGIGAFGNFLPLSNVMVVEATGRNGERAPFSNVGGHISAPGVDILSTSAKSQESFAVCSGTSQAAPFVSSIAAILFELNPSLRPREIAALLKRTASKSGPYRTNGAMDPMEAVLSASNSALIDIADLNGDGKVDEADLKIFHQRYMELQKLSSSNFEPVMTNGAAPDSGQGRCAFPDIDLNGSGVATTDLTDKRRIKGVLRTDIEVLELAWTSREKTFRQALKDNPLPVSASIAANEAAANICPR